MSAAMVVVTCAANRPAAVNTFNQLMTAVPLPMALTWCRRQLRYTSVKRCPILVKAALTINFHHSGQPLRIGVTARPPLLPLAFAAQRRLRVDRRLHIDRRRRLGL